MSKEAEIVTPPVEEQTLDQKTVTDTSTETIAPAEAPEQPEAETREALEEEKEQTEVTTPPKVFTIDDFMTPVEKRVNKDCYVSETDRKSVFCRNVPFDATKEELFEHFKSCGEIERVSIPLEGPLHQPKGRVYVEFKDETSVPEALKKTDHEFKGRKIQVLPKYTNPHRLAQQQAWAREQENNKKQRRQHTMIILSAPQQSHNNHHHQPASAPQQVPQAPTQASQQTPAPTPTQQQLRRSLAPPFHPSSPSPQQTSPSPSIKNGKSTIPPVTPQFYPMVPPQRYNHFNGQHHQPYYYPSSTYHPSNSRQDGSFYPNTNDHITPAANHSRLFLPRYYNQQTYYPHQHFSAPAQSQITQLQTQSSKSTLPTPYPFSRNAPAYHPQQLQLSGRGGRSKRHGSDHKRERGEEKNQKKELGPLATNANETGAATTPVIIESTKPITPEEAPQVAEQPAEVIDEPKEDARTE